MGTRPRYVYFPANVDQVAESFSPRRNYPNCRFDSITTYDSICFGHWAIMEREEHLAPNLLLSNLYCYSFGDEFY
jgi:hypothetical protein